MKRRENDIKTERKEKEKEKNRDSVKIKNVSIYLGEFIR
jgi:hypothetical protein